MFWNAPADLMCTIGERISSIASRSWMSSFRCNSAKATPGLAPTRSISIASRVHATDRTSNDVMTWMVSRLDAMAMSCTPPAQTFGPPEDSQHDGDDE